MNHLSKLAKNINKKGKGSEYIHLTKELYDFTKSEEQLNDLKSGTLSALITEGVTAEQIWQQLDIHYRAVFDEISVNYNLCSKVAELSNSLEDDDKERSESSNDEGVELEDDTEADDEVRNGDKTSDLDESDSDAEDEAEDKPDESEQEEDDEKLSEFSDLDADTFGDIALEGEDSDEDKADEEVKNENDFQENETNKPQDLSVNKFQSTSVDSQFLKLRESEWVADNDVIGKDLFDDGEESIDLMEDIDEGNSDNEAGNAMYDSFFDPPDQQNEDMLESKDEDEEDEPLKNNKEEKSEFCKTLEKEVKSKGLLEEEFFLKEKPWVLKGEISKEQRPENSTLEEHMDYIVSVRQKPIITEDTTEKIEKLLLSRIRNQAWDDVERKIKPSVDPFQYKQKLILDQEKSKKSLAEIYEEEYLKQQSENKASSESASSVLLKPDEKIEELPVHKEIKEAMQNLFMTLDSLTNYHYTPKYKNAEVKVVKNLAAISIEESTPMTVTDATLLAPQEVVAPVRGEMKGETEKEKTDKLRERRGKKKHQKLKARREEEKLKHQLKKRTKDGKLDAGASVKVVQKALKKGQLKTLDGDQKAVKSSAAFFEQLQTNVKERTTKKRKANEEAGPKPGKKKKNKELTLAKLLL